MLQRSAKIAQTIALLAFCLPWATVSCGEQQVAKLSGINIASGSAAILNPATGSIENYSGMPSFVIYAALFLVAVGLVANLIFAARRAATAAVICSMSAIALILYQLFASGALSAQRRGMLETIVTGTPDVKTAFGFWVTIVALGVSVFYHHNASLDTQDNVAPALPSKFLGIAVVLGILVTPNLMQPSDAIASDGTIPLAREAKQKETARPKLVEAEITELPVSTSISIQPLRPSDTAHIEGVSCWATDDEGSAFFASDGKGLIRINGDLIKLDEQDGSIGGDALRSKDGEIIVTFTKRPGKTKMLEEGIAKTMTMNVFVDGGNEALDITRSCGA